MLQVQWYLSEKGIAQEKVVMPSNATSCFSLSFIRLAAEWVRSLEVYILCHLPGYRDLEKPYGKKTLPGER